jgi:hypothetical protein
MLDYELPTYYALKGDTMTDFFAKIDQASIFNLIAAKAPYNNPTNDYNCFAIPAFQRKYMWEKSHWQKFWEDAEEHVNSNEPWFLGSIITLRTNVQNKASHHDIIDGQQRLTTIFIFRIAVFYVMNQLSASMSQLPDKNDFDFLKNYLLNVCSTDRLVHTNDFVDVAPQQTRLIQLYEKYAKASDDIKIDKRSKYYNAFEFFRKKLMSLIENLDLISQNQRIVEYISIVNNAQVIWAQVNDLPNAMAMFEVLNNRGKPLNATDIIKTSFLKHLVNVSLQGVPDNERSALYTKNIKDAGEFWDYIGKRLIIDNNDELSLKRFLRHFYIIYFPTLASNKDLPYRSITEKQVMRDYDVLFAEFRDKDSFNDLRTSLNKFAIYYGILRDPLRDDSKILVPEGMRYLSKFITNRRTTRIEHYIAHILSDINKLGLVQINLLNLYIFSVFMDNITSDREYNARIKLLHIIFSSVFRFVIRRNLTDVPRPNQTDSKLTELMNHVESKNSKGLLNRLFADKPLEKLKIINEDVNQYITLSADTLSVSVSELRYGESSNLEVRFLLHFLEKWDVQKVEDEQAYILRNFSSPFDGFKRSNGELEYEIEHIMPKSLLKNDSDEDDAVDETGLSNDSNIQQWKQDLTKWSSSFCSKNEDDQAMIIHSLGNLTLLSHNSQASNLPFDKKQTLENGQNIKIGYQAPTPSLLNSIPVSKEDSSVTLKNVNKWTEIEIKVRTNQMQQILHTLLGDIKPQD